MFGLLPAFIITRLKVKPGSLVSELRARGIALTLIVLLASISSYLAYKNIVFVFRENRQLTFIINPIYPILSLKRYYDQQAKKEVPFNYVFNDATKEMAVSHKTKKSVFVLVVGETARASNFHINGYARNTTPLIEKENVISLDNVFSCGTATAISVPCLFSHLEHDNYDDFRAKNSENLLDAFKRSGLDVLWRDNNSGCKGVCQRVTSENMHHLDLDDYCSEDGCFDEVLLHDLQDHIDSLKSDGIIVLHQQGSHGPAYYKRYPDNFAVFEPACDKANVQDCSYNEIVNAYDNTILYTDYFLSKVIQLLKINAKVYDTAMLYVSDHGESLGENGVYLHGLPYFLAPKDQVHVPLYIWLSDEFSKNTQVDIPCLKQKQHDRYSHDNIVHSLLGVMGVKTRAYKIENDIFSSCKTLS
jgi:lipid A ethanolaminephosphotransferase